jgi:hypothetical protein
MLRAAMPASGVVYCIRRLVIEVLPGVRREWVSSSAALKVREPYLVTTHSRVEERVLGASDLLQAVKDVLE